MTPRRSHCVVGSLLWLIFGAALPCATADVIPSTEQLLREKYHVALTKDALLAALSDARHEVRVLAADRLAGGRHKDAVPAILWALAAETDPWDRTNLAASAARLGAEEGIEALTGMCHDPAWGNVSRMVAAQTMFVVGREGCLRDVLDVLRLPDGGFEGVFLGIHVLSQFKHVPARELQEIRNLVPVYLKSDNIIVRERASDVLREFGDSSAIPDLRTALAIEQDDLVRKTMSDNLKALEAKQTSPAVQNK